MVRFRTPRDLASRVRCVANEAYDRIFPNQFPSLLRVRLENSEARDARFSRTSRLETLRAEDLEV